MSEPDDEGDEGKVRDLLGQAFEVDPPASARPSAEGVRAGHRRRRVAGSAGLAGAVTAVVVAAIVVPGLNKQATPVVAGAPSDVRQTPAVLQSAGHETSAVPAPSSGPAGLTVLADGQTIEAAGRVVSMPGKPVRLCGPEENDLVAYAPGHEPAPRWCPLGIDVTGVDLASLSQRREKEGAVEGYAYVRGTYRADHLAVSIQATPRYPTALSPAWNRPPCPAPAGGWTSVGNGGNPTKAEDAVRAVMGTHRDEVVTTVIMRATSTTAVVVVAAQHPDVVRAALPHDSTDVCVVQSRYSRQEIDAARAPWEADYKAAFGDAAGGDSNVAMLSESVGEDGQAVVQVGVLRVTPEVLRRVAQSPVGLVQVTPWLRQVSLSAPLPPPMPSGQPSPFVTDTGTGRPSAVPTAPTGKPAG